MSIRSRLEITAKSFHEISLNGRMNCMRMLSQLTDLQTAAIGLTRGKISS